MARRRSKRKDESDLVKLDGALALTFVNTGSRRSPLLQDYADLLRWAVKHNALSATEGSRLEQRAVECPEDIAATFATAQELHALLSRIMNGLADSQAPASEVVRELNVLLARSVPRRVMIPGTTPLRWDWPMDNERDFYRPLWSVGLSVATVLTSKDYSKVRRCTATDCDVLFLAKGRGPARKWCSSQSCGAPARARQYYLEVIKPGREAHRPDFNRFAGRYELK